MAGRRDNIQKALLGLHEEWLKNFSQWKSKRLKRKREFEIEKDEKNPLKIRFVGHGGKNEEEEVEYVDIRNEYEIV